MVPHLPVTYDDLEIYVVHDHETKISGFKIGLHDHLNVSGAMAVGIDAHHGKAEFKIHYLDLDNSEPPVASATRLESRHNTNYFIHHSTTWQGERHIQGE